MLIFCHICFQSLCCLFASLSKPSPSSGNVPDDIRPKDLSSKTHFLLFLTLTNLMFYLLYKMGLTNFTSLIHYISQPELIYLLLADLQVFSFILSQCMQFFKHLFYLSFKSYGTQLFIFSYYFNIPIKVLLGPFPLLINFTYISIFFNKNLGRILDTSLKYFQLFFVNHVQTYIQHLPSVMSFELSSRLLTLNVTVQQINRVSRKVCSIVSVSPPLVLFQAKLIPLRPSWVKVKFRVCQQNKKHEMQIPNLNDFIIG